MCKPPKKVGGNDTHRFMEEGIPWKSKDLRREPACFIEGIAKSQCTNALRKEGSMGGEVRDGAGSLREGEGFGGVLS